MEPYNELCGITYKEEKDKWIYMGQIPKKLIDQFMWLIIMCSESDCPPDINIRCEKCWYGIQINKIENWIE